MALVGISIYLQLILRHKFLFLVTYRLENLYLTWATMWRSVVIFCNQKGFTNKNVWEHWHSRRDIM